jgi:hypothetical protein
MSFINLLSYSIFFVEHHIYNVPIEPSKEETFEHSESFFDDVLL